MPRVIHAAPDTRWMRCQTSLEKTRRSGASMRRRAGFQSPTQVSDSSMRDRRGTSSAALTPEGCPARRSRSGQLALLAPITGVHDRAPGPSKRVGAAEPEVATRTTLHSRRRRRDKKRASVMLQPRVAQSSSPALSRRVRRARRPRGSAARSMTRSHLDTPKGTSRPCAPNYQTCPSGRF